ncbi:DUF4402 domain-containing protein [Erythrobacter sp. YT30]|uniref:DUF4402 domain-containing protein n=1 Tax=Erythrobacter sp. YT30 TaxID=1735012 RepID=UPI00076BEAAE|nr:DUF4402 domain-containing protein [Erythrobacter sp. YT30]KWV91482.1 hypothetical protein AUC45_09535 [Erythrobacter sp. YT30]
MPIKPLHWCGITLALASLSAPAVAAPGDTTQESGVASATVADPITIQRVSDLRFGRFASPGTASTITVNVDGSFSAAGDVASSTNMAQPASGRGPAQFTVEQAGNRGGTVFIPGNITITSGANSMLINSITARLVVISGFGRNRVYRLDLGGTLRVNANQAPGSYLGDFDVTVIYN